MLNALKLFFLFVCATVFHWAFAGLFARVGLSVNVILIFVTAFCALFKLPFAYSAAFICGLFLDFFSTKLFGGNAFTFTVCACIICNIAPRFDFAEPFPQMVAVFVLTWLAALLNTLLVFVFASASAWRGLLSTLGGSVVDALFAPAVFWLVKRVLGTSSIARQV